MVNQTSEYPWYKIIEDSTTIEQGDIIYSCSVVLPANIALGDVKEIDAEMVQYNVIIMSQSCDLERKNIDLVLVCPFHPLSEIQEKYENLKGRKGIKELKGGGMPGYHLLNRIDITGFEQEPTVVDFRNVYGVPFGYLEEMIRQTPKRIRLLPPYREHLSQAFARFFMRVGLPVAVEV